MMSLQFTVLELGDDDEWTLVAMLLGVHLRCYSAALAPHCLYAQCRSRNGAYKEDFSRADLTCRCLVRIESPASSRCAAAMSGAPAL